MLLNGKVVSFDKEVLMNSHEKQNETKNKTKQMVQAKMPFFFLLMYQDWPLMPFIVFCCDKNIINIIYFIPF